MGKKKHNAQVMKRVRQMGFDTLEDLIKSTAIHESAHAVMRVLLNLRPGYITIGMGSGYSSGTGQEIPPKHDVYITLAGYAAEFGYGKRVPNFEFAESDDFTDARTTLLRWPYLRMRIENGQPVEGTVNEYMDIYFRETCHMLHEHKEVIEGLANTIIKQAGNHDFATEYMFSEDNVISVIAELFKNRSK